jgi:hypothetical protein
MYNKKKIKYTKILILFVMFWKWQAVILLDCVYCSMFALLLFIFLFSQHQKKTKLTLLLLFLLWVKTEEKTRRIV